MAQLVKNPTANAGDARGMDSIPESGRSPGGGHGNPLQYACPENPMDRGAWWATVHGVTRSRTRLNEHTHDRKRSSTKNSRTLVLTGTWPHRQSSSEGTEGGMI